MTKKDASNRVLILNKDQIIQKINRIAYQILEDNLDEKEIYIAGMGDRGFTLAKKIQDVLQRIGSCETVLLNVRLNAKQEAEVINLEGKIVQLKNKVIILVDDVLNSGKTLSYGLSAFLKESQKKIRTAVLVDKSHKVYPISTDFAGLSLATVLKEHIEVVLEEDADLAGVYLS